MTTFTTLEPSSVAVDPGASETTTVRLRNDGDTVEEYRLSVVGDPAEWTQIAPDTLRLYPGDEGSASVVFSPPRAPETAAGAVPFGILVQPQQNPELSNVAEGVLDVSPYGDMRAELLPVTVRGRLSARFRVAVDNVGNAPLSVGISGQDDEEVLDFRPSPETMDIAQGRTRLTRVRIRPGGVKFLGQPERYPFALTVEPAQDGLPDRAVPVPPAQLRGTFIRLPLFPRWLLVTLGLLTAGATVFTVLWFVPRPPLVSNAVAQQLPPAQPANALPPPPQTPPPVPAPPPAAASPSPSPEQSAEQEQQQDGEEEQAGAAQASAPAQDGIATIRSAQNGQVLGLQDDRTDDGTAVVLADDKQQQGQGPNPLWVSIPYADGTVVLAPNGTLGSVLDQTGGEAPVELRTVAGGEAAIRAGQASPLQRWRLEPESEGIVMIVNSQTGGCLTNMGNSLQVQVRPCDDAFAAIQRWQLVDPVAP
ncbi:MULTISPECIES: hypothetical protein [Streptomyces]|uniref:hypothetical protein n=1 Tax=Streptomyces TaxID=1883 RepID=UPI0006AE3D84|nr:hypothetical protein [Streptomyces sp. AS58]